MFFFCAFFVCCYLFALTARPRRSPSLGSAPLCLALPARPPTFRAMVFQVGQLPLQFQIRQDIVPLVAVLVVDMKSDPSTTWPR